MANQMKSTSKGFDAVLEEHRETIDFHLTALANIFQRAGAGDPIDTMVLQPYVASEMIKVVWDRTQTVEGTTDG